MIAIQSCRSEPLFIGATAATNGTAASNMIDTAGYRDALLLVDVQTTQNTTAPSVLSVQESDTTDATNFADITGLVGGTNDAGGFTIAATPTATPTEWPYALSVHLDGARKRYLRVVGTPGAAGATFNGVALLDGSRAQELPNTEGELNAAVVVKV